MTRTSNNESFAGEMKNKGIIYGLTQQGRVRLVRFDAVLDGKVGCLVHVSRYRLYGVA